MKVNVVVILQSSFCNCKPTKHLKYCYSLEILDRVSKFVKEGESSTPLFLYILIYFLIVQKHIIDL